ncbi:hypothetical protein [Cellulomonas endophytica]|uniref:hypothetical protein n=1 Tax=Cellulomonas endophytica TaxID=2494735 RepID=UPI0010110615|nr:hypothetical protein [Cellulomonas endophytica]
MTTTTEPAGPAGAPAGALAWAHPPGRLPDLLPRARTRPGTWFDLHRSGALVAVADGTAARCAALAVPAVRAAALASLVPARAALARTAAAWVHVGGPPPTRVEVVVPTGARRVDPHPGRVALEAALPAADLVTLGPVRVTTPARTAADVARALPPEDARPWLRRLADGGLEVRDVLDALAARPGGRGVRQARALLLELGGT